MASNVAKRPNGRWRARYRDENHREHARHFHRKIDAQRWLAEIEGAIRTGSYVDPDQGRELVRDLAARWLDGKINLRPTTCAVYESVLRVQVLPRWGSSSVKSVTHAQVQKWISELAASDASAAHVRKVHRVLAGVLDLAVHERRIATNPAAKVNLPTHRPTRRRYLSAVQVQTLASFAERDAAVVYTLAYCGLRWSEMAALRVRSLDVARRRLIVDQAVTEVNGGRLHWDAPKSHESRTVPVPRFLMKLLLSSIAGRDPGELLFPAPEGGVLRNRNARRSWFDRAVFEAGLDGLTPHELRHTAASLAISAGANVKAVQRMLGHASAAMTLDTYADLFDDDLDSVADRLDAVATTARRSGADYLRTGAELASVTTAAERPLAQ